jgi:hypothetical protein
MILRRIVKLFLRNGSFAEWVICTNGSFAGKARTEFFETFYFVLADFNGEGLA